MSVMLEFSISPLDKGASVGEYVAKAVDIVDKSGVAYRLNPMGTVLEGEWDEVFGVVKLCYERLAQDCDRISITMKVDFRKGQGGRLTKKTEAVERMLGRELSQ